MSDRVTATIASHIIVVYNTMEREAVRRDDLMIYTGSLSKIFKELGISMSFYKTIFRTLYDNGYCALGDRGGRNKPSTIILLRAPKRDELLDLTVDESASTVSLVNRVEVLESNAGGLNIVSALAEFERRLVLLEDKESRPSGKSKVNSKVSK